MKHARLILLAILLLRLVLGVAYSAANPLGEAPDEADHYAYAAYLGTHHALPVGPEITQSKHPPLYHFLAAVAALPAGSMDFTFLRSNPDGGVTPTSAPNFFVHTTLESWPWHGGALAMHLGRLVSVLAGLVLVAATYGIGRRLWPDRPGIALAGAAFVAFMPESLFIGGSMSNDMLAAMFCGLALWAGLARPARARPGAWLWMALPAGACMGLAFITKVSTVGLWPVAVACLLLGALGPLPARPRDAWRQALTQVRERPWMVLRMPLVACLLAAAIAAPLLWRNLYLYGDPLGMALVRATVDQRTAPMSLADYGWLLRGWFFSFWGKFGAAGHLPLPAGFYWLWGALLLLAAAGWLRWLMLSRRRQGLAACTDLSGHLVLWAAPLLAAASILSYSQVALGTDQGRLLFPALAPLGLVLAAGLAAWPPRQSTRPAVWSLGFAALMLATGTLAFSQGILAPFAPPAAPSPAVVAAATPSGATFGPALELIGFQWEQPAGADARLTLYWRGRQPLNDDLRTDVRLVAADGHLAWEAKRSPAAGRFSTDRWPAGRVVADTYTIPATTLAQAARAELGVRPFPERPWLQPTPASGSDFIPLALPAR